MSSNNRKEKVSTGWLKSQSWDLLIRYLRPLLPRVLAMAGLLFVGIALQLINPQVIRYFLDTAQAGGSLRALSLAAIAFITFALFQQGMTLLASYTSQKVSWSATNQLRRDLTLHCLRLDMSFHKRRTPGELIQRIDGDVTELANFFSQFVVRVLGNGLLVLGILLLLFREDVWVGLGMTGYVALSLIVLASIQRLAVSHWAAARQASAEQSGFLEERISGVEDIRAVGAEPYVMRRLYTIMRSFLEKLRGAIVIRSLTFNLANLVYAIGYTAGLALGVYLYLQDRATIGTAYLVVYYVGMVATPLQAIREQAQDLQQATASIQRVQELLSFQPLVRDPVIRPKEESQAGAIPRLPPSALSVSFCDVSFRYDENENVLKDVSFELRPGKVLGVLGRTGSGKSTLTRLLFRLYDPTQGSVRLNGVDLRQILLTELHSRVGMVTQDVQLFQATVRENLTFFNPRNSDDRLVKVLGDLGMLDWVQSLPEGLDTRLAGGSQGLSAGEAQLLALARVFLKDPGLVILDEASSRLDPVTEARMEQAVDRLFAGRTGVVIAHRLKTVQRADELLILENGKVIEQGSYAFLARDPGSRFYQLLQAGLEEALA